MRRTDAVPGFDADGPDTIDQQQANVLATLQLLSVEPSTRVLNVGSGIYPLTLPEPWRKPLNIDTEEASYALHAAEQHGADYQTADILWLAEAARDGQQRRPESVENLPGVILLYRIGPFVQLYHGADPAQFWDAAWTVLRPGGWLLLMNPPSPALGLLPLWDTYQGFRATIEGHTPAEVVVVSSSGVVDDALAVAVRKPSPAAPPASEASPERGEPREPSRRTDVAVPGPAGTDADATKQADGAVRSIENTKNEP